MDFSIWLIWTALCLVVGFVSLLIGKSFIHYYHHNVTVVSLFYLKQTRIRTYFSFPLLYYFGTYSFNFGTFSIIENFLLCKFQIKIKFSKICKYEGFVLDRLSISPRRVFKIRRYSSLWVIQIIIIMSTQKNTYNTILYVYKKIYSEIFRKYDALP